MVSFGVRKMLRKFIFLINVVQVFYDCDVPATHPDVFIYRFVATAKEGHRLSFECDDSLGNKYGAFRVAYSLVRVCSKKHEAFFEQG